MIDRDTIIKLAREAGLTEVVSLSDSRLFAIERFAALVAAAERDQCADIVENADTPDCGGWTAQGIADDIRARSNHA